MTSAATKRKAQRLLDEGRVQPGDPTVRHFVVEGDSGVHDVFIGAVVRRCTCDHGIKGSADDDCSHLTAIIEGLRRIRDSLSS